jgi:hypothetical protein
MSESAKETIMDSTRFDRLTESFGETRDRRAVLRLLGVAAFGAGSLSLLGATGSEAKRRRRRKKKKAPVQPETPPTTPPPPPTLFPDIAITSITIETTAEANHDNVVVTFVNNGTQTATGFRIGMTAKRTNGQVRNEVFSAPLTLGPGIIGVEKFRLGCNWFNNGLITARTDLSPIPGEPAANTADNTLAVNFANVCS